MTIVVRFHTRLLDTARERPNPINPIPGESLLRWLGERLDAACRATEPEAEDWGWASAVVAHGDRYLLGSSACDPDDEGRREWVLQIERRRSVKERLMGRGRTTAHDRLVEQIVGLLAAEPAFERLQVEAAG